MELQQIKTALQSPQSQERLKAIASLREYPPENAVPLLLNCLNDQEFIIRSFVAMGLGYKRSPESYEGLLQLLKDPDANVRAEAANSLASYGKASVPQLMEMFQRDDHWLVRQSILAAMGTLNCPLELWQLCQWGINDPDPSVQEVSIESLVLLIGTNTEEKALNQLLSLITVESHRIRVQVAYSLHYFKHPLAQTALNQLKQDQDHRVVGAVLEGLL